MAAKGELHGYVVKAGGTKAYLNLDTGQGGNAIIRFPDTITLGNTRTIIEGLKGILGQTVGSLSLGSSAGDASVVAGEGVYVTQNSANSVLSLIEQVTGVTGEVEENRF